LAGGGEKRRGWKREKRFASGDTGEGFPESKEKRKGRERGNKRQTRDGVFVQRAPSVPVPQHQSVLEGKAKTGAQGSPRSTWRGKKAGEGPRLERRNSVCKKVPMFGS
jgi:hypothetical protein